MAQGDALFVRATVDGVPVHGFQIVVRRSAQGERLFVRPSGAPTRFDRLGSWSLSAEQAWQAARAEAPPVRYDDAAQARRHSATYRAWLVRDQACCRFISFTKRRPFRCGVMRASSMRSAAPS